MAVTAIEQRPPSPPSSLGDELHYGFHHLIQHNAVTSFPTPAIDGDSTFSPYHHEPYHSPAQDPSESLTARSGDVPLRRHLNAATEGNSQSQEQTVGQSTRRFFNAAPAYSSQYNRDYFSQTESTTDTGLGIDWVWDDHALGLEASLTLLGQNDFASTGLYQERHDDASRILAIEQKQARRQPITSSLYRTAEPEKPQYHHSTTQMESPPSSTKSDHSSGKRRTRSGRAIGGSRGHQPAKSNQTSQARVTKTPRTGRPRGCKADKAPIPKLDAPLSTLTAGYKHIPIRDMEQWVTRSAEVRQQEVDKRNGYVTRPMNSFMLYRSAYSERIKMWCLKNNHQFISRISGASWPLETAEIRDQYNNYAKIERDNHHRAHPGYKFSPSKNAGASKKRAAEIEEKEEAESEPSDLEDVDYGWNKTPESTSRPKARKRAKRDSRQQTSSPAPSVHARFTPDFAGGLEKSLYSTNNPGRTAPTAMSGHEERNPYYQTSIHPSMSLANVEDVRLKPGSVEDVCLGLNEASRMQQPDFRAGLNPLAGNSSLSRHGLSQRLSPGVRDNPKVDPALLAYDHPLAGGHSGGPIDDGNNHGYHDFLDFQSGQVYDMDGSFGMMNNQDYLLGQPTFDLQQLPGYNPNMQVILENNDWQVSDDGASEWNNWFE